MDYIKITDYAVKDTLLTGDPAKLVKGSEIGADFDAVAVAVATKADTTDIAAMLETTDIGVSVQAYSANLDEYAAVNPTAAGLALLDDDTSGDQLTTLGGTTVGKAVFVAATVAAAQQAMDVEVGVDVQAYDADTAKLDVDQTWTGAQRGTVTVDADGDFDCSVTNHFRCTPTGAITNLKFSNPVDGQSGMVLWINTSNYAITAVDASTYISAADKAKLAATGRYVISYLTASDGTNTYTYCTVSAALTSAGA
jgi:hypothetical protein